MSDIWGQHIQNSPYQKSEFGAGDPNLLFVGAEKSGKTSLMNLFFGKQEEPQPTLALTYQSASIKASGRSILLHAWELGGGLHLESILKTIITKNAQKNFLIFISLDLSNASSILDGIEWIERISSTFEGKKRGVFLIGTHYDVFEGKEAREKEIIVKGLKAVASQHGAGLCFVSTKNETLKKRFTHIVKYIGLANSKIKEKELDITKPLLIPPNEDAESPNDSESYSIMMNELHQQAEIEDAQSAKDTSNPAENPQFREEDIDQLRIARKSELAGQIKTRDSKK